MKTIKKEFGEHLLTASKLPQIKANLELFKLTKVLLPSASVLTSDNAENTYLQLFSLLSHHSTVEHFESLQSTLFNCLLDDQLEPVTDLETFFESKQCNSLDVLFWLFKANLAEHFISSVAFKKLSPLLNNFKSVIGLNEGTEEELEEAEDATPTA